MKRALLKYDRGKQPELRQYLIGIALYFLLFCQQWRIMVN